jgi:microcystin-dependent protein
MADPFFGEIRIFSFSFPPKGWALCNGQILQIQQNQALFSLMGTTYGGDGRVTFALPNLQGRAPLHMGDGIVQGQRGGAASVTLLASQIQDHTHGFIASASPGTEVSPAGRLLAQNARGTPGFKPVPGSLMAGGMIAPAGGGQPHSNMQPYLVLNFCVALTGIFPTRN